MENGDRKSEARGKSWKREREERGSRRLNRSQNNSLSNSKDQSANGSKSYDPAVEKKEQEDIPLTGIFYFLRVYFPLTLL